MDGQVYWVSENPIYHEMTNEKIQAAYAGWSYIIVERESGRVVALCHDLDIMEGAFKQNDLPSANYRFLPAPMEIHESAPHPASG